MIALALAALAGAPAPASYPSAQVLAAFGEACRDLKDLSKTEAKAKSAGWAAFMPEPASPMGQLLEFGMTEGRKQAEAQGGSISPMRILRRQVAGEELVLVLSGASIGGVFTNGCRLYDVGETRQIATAEAERWIGRPASKSETDAMLSVTSWQPGYRRDHDSFEIYFIPANSPALEVLKVSGVTLKADLVGAD